MLKRLSLTTRHRFSRGALVVAFFLLGSTLVSSCLTPEFVFDEDGAPLGEGGAGTGGGNHCDNRSHDFDETDTDCGGRDCEPCALGRSCEAGSDCINGTCTNLKCQNASCTDGDKNASETDEDCGGGGCPPCADTKRCEENTDCESRSCKGGVCAAPTCTDRIQNGTESDIDCGGDCEQCESGGSCVINDDCIQPPEDDPSVSICQNDVCTLVCGIGLGDCNRMAGDGCETNLNTTLEHCGECAAVCAPAHAEGMCQGGNCLIDREAPDTTSGCVGNWRDCNNMDEDGCESNINTNVNHCGMCDEACSATNGTPSCSAGQCSIACENGYSDCDADARSNGCEINTNTNSTYCGGCDEEDECDGGTPTQSAYCSAGMCGYTDCTAGLGDCNGTGVCTDSLTTVNNCGTCGNKCTVTNGSPACENQGGDVYACGVVTCNSGGGQIWNDCDDLYVNGCEVNTQTNKFRCGGCLPGDANGGSGQDCTSIESDLTKRVTATECSAGGCRIVSCSAGFADCNGVFSDGCEVNTTNNKGHCGGCTSGPTTTWDGGFVCDNLYANATGTCSNSTCSFNQCATDYGDCNLDAALGSAGNGCETYLVGNDSHCGACGNTCSSAGAGTSGNVCTASSGRACNPTCAANYGSCDSNPSNGCEANFQTTSATCGNCATNCNLSIGSNQISGVQCTTSACRVTTCNAGRADCDGTFSNGCEVNMTNTAAHCGGCTSGPTTTWDGGTNCSSSVGSNSITGVSCSSSNCSVSTCAAGRADCDGTFSNGCEINTTNNATHCGGCTSGPTITWDGGINCASKTNATRACVTSSCFWTCQAGWKDSNGDLQNGISNGCETAIIGIINSTTTATGNTNGSITVSHTLATARATNNTRTVVVLVGYDGNAVNLPPAVTYAGTAMTVAEHLYSGNQTWVGIYYILDAALPATSGARNVVITADSNNTHGLTARVVELINVDQSAPLGPKASRLGQQGCTGPEAGKTTAQPLTGLAPDSWVFSAFAITADVTIPVTGSQEAFGQLYFGGTSMNSGVTPSVSPSTTASWSCSGSIANWSHAVVAFQPEGTD